MEATTVLQTQGRQRGVNDTFCTFNLAQARAEAVRACPITVQLASWFENKNISSRWLSSMRRTYVSEELA